MKFIIEDKVFDMLPEVCFGVVVAHNIDNSANNPEIISLMEEAINSTRLKFNETKPKEHHDIQPYREAFRKMEINPNKFPCSVEALAARIVKGGTLPDINPAVNLVNAFSIKYTLPMGAHDLDSTSEDIEVRFSRSGDSFIPFGEKEPEILECCELVYAAGYHIKTRKWIWRQSDFGKVTETSKNIFFPIDGFANYNYDEVITARNEMAADLEKFFKCKVEKYYLDINNRSVKIWQ
ncbi:MAG: hypothetical protein K0B84_11560 [Firmicutes bacterium]|nr:hypothetical protein [Bacillota bacterium]